MKSIMQSPRGPQGCKTLARFPETSTGSAAGINDQGVVVGGSNDSAGLPRAFLWQNGVMTDFNTLTTGPLVASGVRMCHRLPWVITGLGMTGAGEYHTYMATPIYGADAASYSKWVNRASSVSDDARDLTRQELRFGRRSPASGRSNRCWLSEFSWPGRNEKWRG